MGKTGKYITIGVAGHVDHGKTSLVKNLTGVDTDYHKEEKQRAISIEAGVAEFHSANGIHISLIDVPGHTNYLKNTIRGLSCVDFGILVIAADDGVMPQTLEHVQILELNGVTDGIIVLSKTDMVDKETLELAELEIRDSLDGTSLKDKQIFTCSNTDHSGLEEIKHTIGTIAEGNSPKKHSLPFRMWVDRVRDSRGFGTVVSGTVLSGRLKKDDPVVLMPGDLKTRARTIESHHEIIDEAMTGQRIGINLHKIGINEIKNGMVIAAPDSLMPSYLLNASVTILNNKIQPIHNREKVKLYTGTSLIIATVIIMDKELLNPGEQGLIQLRLNEPLAVLPGDRFIMAHMNIPSIIGGGEIIEITRRKYRKAIYDEIIPSLTALVKGDSAGYIFSRLKDTGSSLIAPRDLAADTGLSIDIINMEISKKIKSGEYISFGPKGIIRAEIYNRVKSELPLILENLLKENPMKCNIKPEELRSKLPVSLSIEPLEKILSELVEDGVIGKEEGGYLLNGFSPEISTEQNHEMNLIFDFASESGFAPFCADTIWKKYNHKYPKKKILKMLSFLRNRNKLVQVNDGRYLTYEAIEHIKEKITIVIKEKGLFVLPDCKAVLGYGRSTAIPVLEYLDDQGFTKRVAEGRILSE